MIKENQEIKDLDEIKEIVEKAHVIHVAMFDEGYPYVIPFNYSYKWNDDQLILYLHGETRGKKIDLLNENNHVGVQMHIEEEFYPRGTNILKALYFYRSFTGRGTAEIVEDLAEKRFALEALLEHEDPETEYEHMADGVIKQTGVIRITLDSYVAKRGDILKKPRQRRHKTGKTNPAELHSESVLNEVSENTEN